MGFRQRHHESWHRGVKVKRKAYAENQGALMRWLEKRVCEGWWQKRLGTGLPCDGL